MNKPDYKKIYRDMISIKFPDKIDAFSRFFDKEHLSFYDILLLSESVSGIQKKETVVFNQMHKSYDEEIIVNILKYVKKNNLNNTQAALHFKLSRNTVAKWKKIFDY